MLRSLYRCVLHLHPPGFRKRFADEMLSIFDASTGKPAAARLLADGLMSLMRQWTLRPEFWHDLSPALQPAPDGIPSFQTLDPFRPRTAAVIHGVVLSTAVFCITCFAIKYSWIHVLHVHIPEVQFDSPRPMRPNPTSAGVEKPAVPLRTENRAPIAPPPPRLLPADAATQSPTAPMAVQNRVARSSKGSKAQEAARPSAGLSSTEAATEASLQSYVGTYVATSPSNLTISITAEGGHLVVKIAGQPRRELVPVSETKFAVSGIESCWIEFGQDGDGTVGDLTQELQLFQNGQLFSARRH